MKTPTLIAAIAARSRRRPCRGRADRLDRRGADGAPPRRNPDCGMGRSSDRHHAARIRARLSRALASRRSSSSSTPTRRAISSRARSPMPTASPVQSREAVERRDRMIEHLASLAAGAGRARPDPAPLRHRAWSPRSPAARGASCASGDDRLCVETRPGFGQSRRDARPSWTTTSASSSSPMPAAPGAAITPISAARNQRQRVHYLLEPGWKADAAIQGLGRSNRTNQAQPPLFRPVATDVKGEKRFLSTIARRLDTLGAITRGQRQTGGQGLFRADDNLESPYARAALRQLYSCIFARQGRGLLARRVRGRRPASISDDEDGSLREELPPITHLPQPRAGAAHRFAEPALRRVRGIARRAHRGRDRRRHLRYRRRDADRRKLPHRRAAHGLHACRDRRRDRLLPGAAPRPQPAVAAGRRARACRDIRRPARRQRAVAPRRGAGSGGEPDAR